MGDSTASTKKRKVANGKPEKPKKPYPDFPLFPHATGRWAKKIRGKFVYFGKWDDPDAALAKYLDQKDDLHAGRTPRVSRDGLTIRDLLNRFLTAKRHLLDTGELVEQTFTSYHRTCERLKDVFGLTRLVEDLASDDFGHLRATLAKTLGSLAMGAEIGRVGTVLKFAYDSGLIDRPVRCGPAFKRPSRSVMRKAKNERGPRMFEAGQIRQLLSKASPQLKAMVLLGINCGFGNHDVGTLPQSALDLDGGWVNYPRPKTGIVRRCPLWKETVVAIRRGFEVCPAPKDPANNNLVFITSYGLPWATEAPASSIGRETIRLLQSLDIHRPSLGFYALRHTFRTIADGCGDQVATNSIMGHADASMAANYLHRIDDERLKKVVEHVRRWLFAKPAKGGEEAN